MYEADNYVNFSRDWPSCYGYLPRFNLVIQRSNSLYNKFKQNTWRNKINNIAQLKHYFNICKKKGWKKKVK